MSIFGDLSDLPFPEIFSMLGRRTGHLEINQVPGVPSTVLHLDDARLRGLMVGDEWVSDPLHARDRLIALMDAESGQFFFRRMEQVSGPLDLPAMQLLMSIASAVDEIGAYRNRFAHPETVFRALARETWLDSSLEEFFVGARPYLEAGTSAGALARQLDLSLDQVQLYLYKLRALGKVAPVRGHLGPSTPQQLATAPPAAARAATSMPQPTPSTPATIPAMTHASTPTPNPWERAEARPTTIPAAAERSSPASTHAPSFAARESSGPGFSLDLAQRMLKAMRRRIFAG